MTEAEREIIFQACEKLELEKEWYSCSALAAAGAGYGLIDRYANFYGKHPMNNWWRDDPVVSYWDLRFDYKHQRIMALLFFAYGEG